jgi:putative sigma-54 modulation protein
MHINITARHIELTKSLADYVNLKVEKAEKYLSTLVWAQVILSVEKYRHVAEVVVHGAQTTFRAKEESLDLYAAIDLALDKLEIQLKKFKEKMKAHRNGPLGADRSMRRTGLPAETNGKTSKFKITEIKQFDLKPLSINEAIKELIAQDYKFYMFMNTATSNINLVFVKDDGSYGLIEPQM